MIEKFEVIQNEDVQVTISHKEEVVAVINRRTGQQKIIAWTGIKDRYHSLCEYFSDGLTMVDVLEFMTPPGTNIVISDHH